jgi:hypothetical chaperone protein
MFVGIDFGTSNSSIAVYQGDRLQFFDLDPRHQNPRVLPSFTYIDREHKTCTGVQAIETYLEEETGRRPVWEQRNLGQIQITVGGSGSGPIMYWEDVLVEVDVAAKGRLLQSIKTGLRDPKYDGTQIFDRFYPIEELIALLLVPLREKCERAIGQPARQVVIGRPVKFSDDAAVDQRAQDKIQAAAKLAGFEEVVFELEPVGGAYLYHQNAAQRENVLVFDFGGGTLDMTVIEVGGSTPPKAIATEGVLLGGDDLTATLMQTLFPALGEGSKMDDGLPVPSHIFERLYSWQNIVELSRPMFAEIFRKAKRGDNPMAIEKLETLVNKKLGFKLFQELERVKIGLSSQYVAQLRLMDEGLDLHELILRTRFERLIAKYVAQVDLAIDALMEKSGLREDQIGAVLRTGGSSEIPIFIEALGERFGPERIKELNPFTSIVGGLALKGYEISR